MNRARLLLNEDEPSRLEKWNRESWQRL